MITNLDQRQFDIWLEQIKMMVVNNYEELLKLTIEQIYQQGRMDFINEFKEIYHANEDTLEKAGQQ